MSEENVEIVRRGWEAFDRGDLSAAMEDMSPDIETYVAPPAPVTGTYHGIEGWVQSMLDWAEGFDELVMTAEEYFDAGDQVVVRSRHTSRGAASGVPVEAIFWYVWTIRAGKIVRVAVFSDWSEALEAAGLSE